MLPRCRRAVERDCAGVGGSGAVAHAIHASCECVLRFINPWHFAERAQDATSVVITSIGTSHIIVTAATSPKASHLLVRIFGSS